MDYNILYLFIFFIFSLTKNLKSLLGRIFILTNLSKGLGQEKDQTLWPKCRRFLALQRHDEGNDRLVPDLSRCLQPIPGDCFHLIFFSGSALFFFFRLVTFGPAA